VAREEKQARFRKLFLGLARRGLLQDLLDLVQEKRPHIDWPPIPNGFELPESLADGGMKIPPDDYHVYGD
jgi:hypothetical protein